LRNSSDEENEPFAWATFKNVPVQLTIYEKLDGTFYDLLKMHPESEKHFAWLAQVVFGLAYAQRNFSFIHNDLHGNNIMFVKTDKYDLITEKKRLIDYINRVFEWGPSHFEGKKQISLGKLTAEEWNGLLFKHLDHHLRQFGV
jgi:hypothetical protein